MRREGKGLNSGIEMAPTLLTSKLSMIIPPPLIGLKAAASHLNEAEISSEVRKSFMSTPDAFSGNGSSFPQQVDTSSTQTESERDQVEVEKQDTSQNQFQIFSQHEISRHRSSNDAWISVDGKVYDVTSFLDTHPGGPELILNHIQSDGTKDAGPLMRGLGDEGGHNHSKAAFRMLHQFLIGSVQDSVGSDAADAPRRVKKYRYNVDLTKPIVAQVGYLGADYDEWVHDPVVSKESPRFFENGIYEFFTRTRWWVIPIVWCPVAFGMLYIAIAKEGVPIARLPGLMTFGVIIWSVLEYVLHRFLFHMKTKSFWGNTLHYLLHGFHHKHPMDGSRLVFPPAFASIICAWVWFLMGSWLATYPNKLAIYASALLGYVAYDLTHYFLHFGIAFNDRCRRMKRYHLNHHFKDQMNGFGITTIVWDWLFRTLPSAKTSPQWTN